MSDLLEPQPVGIPAPEPSLLARPYWDACRRGELVFLRCDDCGTIALKPAKVCGQCFGRSLSWRPSAGQGSLYSWTVVWRPQHPSFVVPYAPVIVELDEGYWHIAAMVGVEPDALMAGTRVAVEFHPASDEITLPYYRPVG